MATPEPDQPRPAAGARADELVELTHGLRAELLRRGEFLPSSWVEEAATDLRTDRLRGWVVGRPPDGVGFFSLRGQRAYAHVHVTPGPRAVERAEDLLRELRAAVPSGTARTDAGVTGLTEAEEQALADRVRAWPGADVLERLAMDRELAQESARATAPEEFPEGIERHAVAEIPLEALASLDWLGFQETPDASLIADTVAEDREVLTEIVQGRLGRFLAEASTALVASPGHLVGVLLTAEQSPQRAVFLDLVVHPSHRRRGLGRKLLRFGLRAAAALGYREVRLWVTAVNVPARALYESEGFRAGLRALIYRFTAAGPPQPQAER